MKIIIVATTLIGLATGASAQSLDALIRQQEQQRYYQQQQQWQQDMLYQQQQMNFQLQQQNTQRCMQAIAAGQIC